MKTRSMSNLPHLAAPSSPSNKHKENFNIPSYPEDLFPKINKNSEQINDFLLEDPDYNFNKNRKRKTKEQLKMLKETFYSNAAWTKEIVSELARKTGLSENQVYKWSWDYKKKIKQEGPWNDVKMLVCQELLAPSRLECDLYALQRRYKSALTDIQQKYWNYYRN
ncbi:unnamed protein product [Blepharisma stoltei]|uniref:Homeobox domain-containing protein n=1 Tax=Blepharisma stoltei TaxID=1481888 RepID=A0AAU9IPP9_9CILI|nr:unnamed protein product [Blepharisma stoltei]